MRICLTITFSLFISAFFYSNVLAKGNNKKINKCSAGEHFVNAHYRKSYIRTDGTKVSSANVKAHCQLNSKSYLSWNERISSNPSNLWLRKHEKAKKWTEEEKNRVLESLSDLPPAILTGSVRAIFRLEKSTIYDQNPAAGEAGEIAFYDLAFGPKENLTRIFAHELAHEVYRQLSNVEKDQYRKAADWLLVKNPQATLLYELIPNRDSDAYVANDGPESMTEDFSNNIEYFLFEPETLQKKTPKVYNWIKEKFGDTFSITKGTNK